MSEISDRIREYADILARHPAGTIPAADVLWKLRQILGDPNAGVSDAPVNSGADVRLRSVQMCGAFQPPAQYQRAVYRCTEPDDHEGSHLAEIDGETVGVWPRQTRDRA
ncbi:MAG TPA: hypothetical protein VIP77_16075 [Jiangellaceae bacterium]